MSLTSQLKDKISFPRKFIDKEFPHLKQLSMQINKSLRRFNFLKYVSYPDLYTYLIVGTATDYRIRSYFTNSPYRSECIQNGLRIFSSLVSIETSRECIENRLRFGRNSVANKFNKYSKQFFKRLNPVRRALSQRQEEKLCRYCVLLARIDHSRRGMTYFYFHDAMKFGKFDIERFMSDTDQRLINDIAAVSKLFFRANAKILRGFSTVSHGGVLAGSGDIGGADFDLVVDGCLMEIKTTVKPSITTEHLRQIVGYWLLDYDDEFAIRSAVVYLTRQGYEQRFDVKADLLRTSRSIRELRLAFRDGLKEQLKG